MKCNINSVRTPDLFPNGQISFWAYPKAQTAPCVQKKRAFANSGGRFRRRFVRSKEEGDIKYGVAIPEIIVFLSHQFDSPQRGQEWRDEGS